MRVFIDTSALLALLDVYDQNHDQARSALEGLVVDQASLICTSYVLVEVFSLVQSRLGMAAVRTFQEDIVPRLQIEWMEAQSHARSVAAVLIAGRRQLSLVDCASFDAMRTTGLTTAFTFDRHFAEQGFHCLP